MAAVGIENKLGCIPLADAQLIEFDRFVFSFACLHCSGEASTGNFHLRRSKSSCESVEKWHCVFLSRISLTHSQPNTHTHASRVGSASRPPARPSVRPPALQGRVRPRLSDGHHSAREHADVCLWSFLGRGEDQVAPRLRVHPRNRQRRKRERRSYVVPNGHATHDYRRWWRRRRFCFWRCWWRGCVGRGGGCAQAWLQLETYVFCACLCVYLQECSFSVFVNGAGVQCPLATFPHSFSVLLALQCTTHALQCTVNKAHCCKLHFHNNKQQQQQQASV